MTKFKRLLVIITGLALGSYCLISCGKVTQDVSKPVTESSYTLQATVEVKTTENIRLLSKSSVDFPAKNYYTQEDGTIYVQIIGIENKGVRKELSWGKALLLTKKEVEKKAKVTHRKPSAVSASLSGMNPTGMNPAMQGMPPQMKAQMQARQQAQMQSQKGVKGEPSVSENLEIKDAPTQLVTTYYSASYNKQNKGVKASVYKEALLEYMASKSEWKLVAKKVKREFPLFLVKVYTSKDKFSLRLIDQAEVSTNVTVNVDRIDTYDTFVGVLFQIANQESTAPIENSRWVTTLKQCFDKAFVNALNYAIPKNRVKKFFVDNPVFEFERGLEAECLKLLNLVLVDKEEALIYLDELQQSPISREARSILKENLRAIK